MPIESFSTEWDASATEDGEDGEEEADPPSCCIRDGVRDEKNDVDDGGIVADDSSSIISVRFCCT
jgi:hypothetical protein